MARFINSKPSRTDYRWARAVRGVGAVAEGVARVFLGITAAALLTPSIDRDKEKNNLTRQAFEEALREIGDIPPNDIQYKLDTLNEMTLNNILASDGIEMLKGQSIKDIINDSDLTQHLRNLRGDVLELLFETTPILDDIRYLTNSELIAFLQTPEIAKLIYGKGFKSIADFIRYLESVAEDPTNLGKTAHEELDLSGDNTSKGTSSEKKTSKAEKESKASEQESKPDSEADDKKKDACDIIAEKYAGIIDTSSVSTWVKKLHYNPDSFMLATFFAPRARPGKWYTWPNFSCQAYLRLVRVLKSGQPFVASSIGGVGTLLWRGPPDIAIMQTRNQWKGLGRTKEFKSYKAVRKSIGRNHAMKKRPRRKTRKMLKLRRGRYSGI